MESNTEVDAVYANHLAEVNEVQNVVATQDILNSQGQIVVPEGQDISQETYDKVVKFKLLKPIENSVAIENEIDGKILYQKLLAYLDSDPSISALQSEYHDSELLSVACENICSFQVLRQKLTVLDLQLPKIFNQSLFCGWMGSVVLIKMGAPKAEVIDYFASAMCHDLGMLHISPDVLEKQGEFNHEEWRQMQCHPVISFNIIKSVPKMSAEIAQAVLDHHEQLDGTGYPKGKIGKEICLRGQLLSLLDSVYAIYHKNFSKTPHSLKDVVPFIQMNVHGRYGILANKLIVILRSVKDSDLDKIPDELIPSLIELVKTRKDYIDKSMDLATEVNKKLGFRHNDKGLASIQNSIIHITTSMLQSGLINDAFTRWLDQVLEEKLEFAHYEIAEAHLMMSEVIYQIDKLKRQIYSSMETYDGEEVTQFFQQKLIAMEALEVPPVPEDIENLWKD